MVGRVRRGDRLLVDAPGPGHGRSGFLLQLADGLALRNASIGADDPLTPVVVLAEEGREEAGRRSLARWTGHEARVFRHGREGAGQLPGWSDERVERAFAEAERALAQGLAPTADYARHFHPGSAATSLRGEELVAALSDAVSGWCSQLSASGREAWPVVIVDGLYALTGRGAAGDEHALQAVARALAAAARRGGWILLASERELGDRLDPWFDLRLVLERDAAPGQVHARVAHHRGGPSGDAVRYAWLPHLGRYEPLG